MAKKLLKCSQRDKILPILITLIKGKKFEGKFKISLSKLLSTGNIEIWQQGLSVIRTAKWKNKVQLM